MDQSTSTQAWQAQQWAAQPQQQQQSPPLQQQVQQQPGGVYYPAYAYQQQPQQAQHQPTQVHSPNGIEYAQTYPAYGLYEPQGGSHPQQTAHQPLVHVPEDFDQLMASVLAQEEGFRVEGQQDQHQHAQPQQVLSPSAYQAYFPALSPDAAKAAVMQHLLQAGYPAQQPNANQVHSPHAYPIPDNQNTQYAHLPQGYVNYPYTIGNGEQEGWAFNLEQAGQAEGMVIDPALVMSDVAGPSYSQHAQPQQHAQSIPQTISPELLHPQPQLANPRMALNAASLSPNMHTQPRGTNATASPSQSHATVSPNRQGKQAQASAGSSRASSTSASTSQTTSPPSGISGLDPLLSPDLLDSNPSAIAHALLVQLTGKKTQPADLPTRLKVLRTVRDHAPDRFFVVWAKEVKAVELLKGWLDDAMAAEKPSAEVMMPLLQVIQRLPIGIDALRTTQLGKSVRMAVKTSPTTAIKDVAQKLEQRWKGLVSQHVATVAKTDSDKESTPVGDAIKKRPAATTEDARKRRKIAEQTASSSKATPSAPMKKEKTAAVPAKPTSVRPVVKSATTTSGATVKDAKVDSGFFSSSKPKPKLPSFRKTAAISTSTDVKMDSGSEDKPKAPVNTVDAFQEALKSLNKKTGIGDKGTPPVESKREASLDVPAAPVDPTKPLKKRKSVTFAVGDALLKIKLIEPAIYDDELPGEHHGSARDLDRAEGLALAHAIFDEEIDWYEPYEIEFPPDPPTMSYDKGSASQEKAIQETRERMTDEVVYDDPASIPASPTEIAHESVMPDDKFVKRLKLPRSFEDLAPEEDPDAPSVKAAVPNVAELLHRIAGGAKQSAAPLPQSQGSQLPPNGLLPTGQTLANLGIDPAQLANIIASMPAQGGADQQQQGYGAGSDWAQAQDGTARWNGAAGDGYDGDRGGYAGASNGFRGQSDQGWGSRGRPGRGRGGGAGGAGAGAGGRGAGPGRPHQKGQRQIPCQYFQQGRCKYGDDCDYLHLDSFAGLQQ